jgi:hypothetical protein
MSSITDLRKVQGKQWYLTLPQLWREVHKVKRGDVMNVHFAKGSVLVVAPAEYKLSDIEKHLIQLLVDLPSRKDHVVFIEELKKTVDELKREVDQL